MAMQRARAAMVSRFRSQCVGQLDACLSVAKGILGEGMMIMLKKCTLKMLKSPSLEALNQCKMFLRIVLVVIRMSECDRLKKSALIGLTKIQKAIIVMLLFHVWQQKMNLNRKIQREKDIGRALANRDVSLESLGISSEVSGDIDSLIGEYKERIRAHKQQAEHSWVQKELDRHSFAIDAARETNIAKWHNIHVEA